MRSPKPRATVVLIVVLLLATLLIPLTARPARGSAEATGVIAFKRRGRELSARLTEHLHPRKLRDADAQRMLDGIGIAQQ